MRSYKCLLLAALAATVMPLPSDAAVSIPGLEEALQTQRDRASQHPGDSSYLNDLGNLLVLSGKTDEAEATYRQALQQGADNANPIRLNLGLLLQQVGRNKEAIKEFDRLTQADPYNPWPHYQRGMSFEAMGHERKAIRNYVKAFSLDFRLTYSEYNPQIITSNLATQALVTAYQEDPKISLAPRAYSQPSLIRNLIVPQLTRTSLAPAAAETAEPARTEEPDPAAAMPPSESPEAVDSDGMAADGLFSDGMEKPEGDVDDDGASAEDRPQARRIPRQRRPEATLPEDDSDPSLLLEALQRAKEEYKADNPDGDSL